MSLTVGSLFSGIGGLDLGLERAGMEVRWQCEIDPYCRAVLGHHWPGLPLYEDIRDIDESAERVDLICGGFPCQPVSLAGKGLAQEDPRWLWPEFARVVGLLRPCYIVVENVPGLRKRGLGGVIGDLAAMGYDAEWQLVSAASVGAPHLRERYIVVAYRPSSERGAEERECVAASAGSAAESRERDSSLSRARDVADDDGTGLSDVERCEGSSEPRGRQVFVADDAGRRQYEWTPEPYVDRVVHGIPGGLDRLRALGNAVVPQVAEAVGRMIMEAHVGV